MQQPRIYSASVPGSRCVVRDSQMARFLSAAVVTLLALGSLPLISGREQKEARPSKAHSGASPQGNVGVLSSLQKGIRTAPDARLLQGAQCSNGVTGWDSPGGAICCHPDCTQCGGSGCGQAGLTADECCVGNIESSGILCSDSGEAPCVIDGSYLAPNPAYSGGSQECSNGISGWDSPDGSMCCSLGCGRCGGPGCGSFGGLTADDCCVGYIESSGILCSDSGAAPCIIRDGSSSPTPTPPTPTTGATPFTTSGVKTIPSKCTTSLASIRFNEETSTSNGGRMYVEGAGCVTMTDLYKTRVEEDGWTPLGPIYILDSYDRIDKSPTKVTGKWLIASDLYITTGAVFYCRGRGIGGDCDELRIQSTGRNDYYEVRGHGGSLYFEDTLVTSWDTSSRRPQQDYEGGRSFLNCVSEMTTGDSCGGKAKNDMGECRMDIIDSEMGYLGFHDSESYGLTWKVRGFCDNESNLDVFDKVDVYGDIIDSDIHHMYYGMYSYGHLGGVWTGNKMHDNHQYGFDPHDDSDYLTIANNDVYNNENHGIIASKRCNNVEIYNNKVSNGGTIAAGIYLHRNSNNAKVYDNYVDNMNDGGIVIMESFDNEIYNNKFSNVKYGARLTTGSGNNNIHDNVFDTCSEAGLYTYEGSEDPWESNNGRPYGNVFKDNEVRSTKMGVWLRDTDDWIIKNNEFTGTEKLEFSSAKDTTWSSNAVTGSACKKVFNGSGFTGNEPALNNCY